MMRWMLASLLVVLVIGQSADGPGAAGQPAETQPTTRPPETSTILRRPAQAEILRNLLGRDERPTPIRPEEPQAGGQSTEGGQALMLEGTFLVERPGRLVREEGHAKLVLPADGADGRPRTLELLPNQLLEAMEREAEAGFTEFIVTAEVTRYKGANYLLLRKILRRVSHGNITP